MTLLLEAVVLLKAPWTYFALFRKAAIRDNAACVGQSKGRTITKRRKIGGIELRALNIVGDAANGSRGDAPDVIRPMLLRTAQPRRRLDARGTSATELADDLDSG
jgi:hypothetical protein